MELAKQTLLVVIVGLGAATLLPPTRRSSDQGRSEFFKGHNIVFLFEFDKLFPFYLSLV